MQLVPELRNLDQPIEHLKFLLKFYPGLLQIGEDDSHLGDVERVDKAAVDHHEGSQDSLPVVGRSHIAQHSRGGH